MRGEGEIKRERDRERESVCVYVCVCVCVCVCVYVCACVRVGVMSVDPNTPQLFPLTHQSPTPLPHTPISKPLPSHTHPRTRMTGQHRAGGNFFFLFVVDNSKLVQ